MSLTKEFIDHALPSLGKHAREALKEINDPALTERTLIYKNLREVGRLNGQKDSDIIAKTICDILDTRAWEDFVDVDGTRRSCESFAKWLELHGLDIKLAEFVVKEKRNDKYGAFLEAKDGRLLTHQEVSRLGGLSRSAEWAETSGKKRAPRVDAEYYRRRLERDAVTNPLAAETLAQVISGSLSISSAVEHLGWKTPRLRRDCQAIINKVLPVEKSQLIKRLGVPQEDFIKAALEEYIKNHPEFTDD